MPTLTDARYLADAVTKAGGTFPASLANLLDATDRLKANRALADEPLGAIVRDAQDGRLTDEALNASVARYAQASALAHAARDLSQAIEPAATAAIQSAFRDHAAADPILESLRPEFNRAAGGIAHFLSLIPNDATPQRVLELGDKAGEAWRQAPQHVAVLSGILGIVRTLVRDFDALGWWDGPHQLMKEAVFFLPDGSDLHAAATEMASGRRLTSHLGPWGQIRSLGPLQLNTATEARAILDGIDARATAAEDERKAAGKRLTIRRPRRTTDLSHPV